MTGEPTIPPPFRLAAYDTIGSTNDEAKHLARDGAAAGLVVWAREQKSGRGRRGRIWVSPPGNLYLSLLLRPSCPAATAAQLGFVTLLGLGDALVELVPAGVELCFKWPNDLLANGRKIAGILLETEMVARDIPDFVVIGVGVNLVSSPHDTAYAATSLTEEGVTGIVSEAVLPGFIGHFAAWLAVWEEEGFPPIREAWLRRASGLGQPIQVRLERQTLDGRFLDLGDDGALMLGMPEGRRRIAAGEIFPVVA
jgi:BirA family transcriptional regulator, biotin operon repressor / biotin---[acetyl-CoA-carboxylase] ligase